jgi:hypothetical protein
MPYGITNIFWRLNGTKMTDVVHYALPWAFRKDHEHPGG